MKNPVPRTRPSSQCQLFAASVLLAFAIAMPFGMARAQGMVQAIPPEEARELNEALGQLARNPRDLSALVAAGNASLQVDDVDAAIGFFGRADDLSPNDPRVKAGLAGAYVRSGRPLDALRLFGEAQLLGGSSGAMAADRGLAYDLIGAPERAQEEYARALAFGRSDEVVRRMALSQAISGDRRKFEATLRPLLEQRDFASYRARAFGLAILGEGGEAADITEAVMSADMATRIAPYLQLMPSLSAAQQAAAANLGKFPAAADVGQDDPQFAIQRAQSGGATLARAEQRLAPQGPALGSRSADAQPQAKPRAQEEIAGVRRRTERTADGRAARRAARRSASDPLTRASRQRRTVVAAAPPSSLPETVPIPSPPVAAPTQTVASAVRQAVPAAATELAAVTLQTDRAAGTAPAIEVASRPAVTLTLPAAVPATPIPQPGFDLAQTSAPLAGPSPVDVAPSMAARAPVTPPPASVADAFGGFAIPARTAAAPSADAVDITAIRPPREVDAPLAKPPLAKPAVEPAPKAAAKPAPPAHPSRIWVQIATGRDRAALKFDWRRFVRQAPATLGENGPFVTTWGQANRLLAGPFADAAQANRAVATLKEKGVDSFVFTSDKGQEIEALR